MRIAYVVGEFFSGGGSWSAAEQLCHNTRTAMKRISEREKKRLRSAIKPKDSARRTALS